MQAIPYFNFEATLDALDFYEKYFGANIVYLSKLSDPMFDDMPEEFKLPTDIAQRKVMNAEFEMFGQRFMASDSFDNREIKNTDVQVAIVFNVDDAEEVQQVKQIFKTAEEAACHMAMPLGEVQWTKLFGMFTDPFGITWMFSGERNV